jgi:hypothetical protein
VFSRGKSPLRLSHEQAGCTCHCKAIGSRWCSICQESSTLLQSYLCVMQRVCRQSIMCSTCACHLLSSKHPLPDCPQPDCACLCYHWPSAGLSGTLPRGLFLLPNLTELNVELNDLRGTLPDDLCRSGNTTTALGVLSLKNNRFSGPATSLLRCTSLTFLDISVGGWALTVILTTFGRLRAGSGAAWQGGKHTHMPVSCCMDGTRGTRQ